MRSSSVPIELSHLSFGNIHYQQRASGEDFASTTQPLPSSSPTVSSKSRNSAGKANAEVEEVEEKPSSKQPSPTPSAPSYAYVELPVGVLRPVYTSGIPLLSHFRDAGPNALDQEYCYRVPGASRYDFVVQDPELNNRREYYLQLFAECYPGEARRFGEAQHASSVVYKFFDDCERLLSRTLVASRVTISDDNQDISGFYLNPFEYQTLYNRFHSYWMRYQRIVQEVTGLPLAIPQWAIDNRPAQVWTAAEFEMFAIKYREEAEAFLSIAFNHRDAVYGSPKPSR